jgi:hypothetical protein
MRLPIVSTGLTLQAELAVRTFSKGRLLSQGILAIVAPMPKSAAVKRAVVVNPAERLVEGFGGRPAVARQFGVSPEAVRQWLLPENGIPTDRALDVEEATRKWEAPITSKEVLEYARQVAA